MEAKVSVSFVPPKKMRQLNRKMRGQSYTPAVLAFPYYERIDEDLFLGEVLICKSEAKKLAVKNKVTDDEQVNALIVHGIRRILRGGKGGEQ
jgi:rRNA maturation RNase YbeY